VWSFNIEKAYYLINKVKLDSIVVMVLVRRFKLAFGPTIGDSGVVLG